MLNVILPSEKKLTIPDSVLTISELKKYVEFRTGIPAEVQLFYFVDAVLNDAEKLISYQDAEFDLLIVIGTSYCICRQGLNYGGMSGSDEIFITTSSKLKKRDLRDIKADVFGNFSARVNDPKPMLEAAKPYIDAFIKDRSNRINQIKNICTQLQQKPLVACTFNWGFRELLANWVASCDRNSIDCRAFSLVFPTDLEADRFARDLGLKTYFHDGAYGELPKEAADIFGDSIFRRMMFAKIAMTNDMLDAGLDIIRQDVDIVWNHDPRYELDRLARQSGSDMLFMYDGENKVHWPLNYNSGFVFIKNNSFSRYAWQLALSNYGRVLKEGGEQRLINTIMHCLMARGLTVQRLDENRFVNGHLISQAIHKDGGLPENSAVVHASWTSDIKPKIVHMKKFGLWFI